MTNTPTTLGRHCPNGLIPLGFKEAVDRTLENARGALDPNAPGTARELSALSDLSRHLGQYGPSPTDPRTYTLWLIAAQMGTLENFDLTGRQRELLARLGGTINHPTPEETFTELVMAGVEDLIEFMVTRYAMFESRVETADARASEAVASSLQVERLELALSEAREVIAGLNDDLREEKSKVDFLRERVTLDAGEAEQEEAQAGPSTDPEKKPRRTKIDGEEGLYVARSGQLEIGWKDDQKKQRWQALGSPDDPAEIEAARELRKSLMGQPYEPFDAGEVVAA